MTSLKIFTLNCWGIPVFMVCKNRKERMKAIGKLIAQSSYDVVLLQEVWHKPDYALLCQLSSPTFPYTEYFHSSFLGSGICVFSKFPILDTIFMKYHLNGHFHKVQHGDWYGGKGIGLVVLNVQGVTVNVYVTHIHAEYDNKNDEYLAHRMSQAFQLSQFIKFSSGNSQLTILGGDLNFEPSDLGLKLIMANGCLKDCWAHKINTRGRRDGNTCDVPENCFANHRSLSIWPQGKRIDYLMYKSEPGWNVSVEDCSVVLARVPNTNLSLSDHEGVAATFSITPGEGRAPRGPMPPTLAEVLPGALEVMEHGLRKVRESEQFFLRLALLLLAALVGVNLFLPAEALALAWLLIFPVLAMAVVMAFLRRVERSDLLALQIGMTRLLNSVIMS